MMLFIILMAALFVAVVWGCLQSEDDRYYDEKMDCEYTKNSGRDFHDF